MFSVSHSFLYLSYALASFFSCSWLFKLISGSNYAVQPDSFYFNVLPFAEDVREFQFPSFSNFPASWQPNEQQLEATENLIKMFDLAPHGKEELFLPDFTPNPILEVCILSKYLFMIC